MRSIIIVFAVLLVASLLLVSECTVRHLSVSKRDETTPRDVEEDPYDNLDGDYDYDNDLRDESSASHDRRTGNGLCSTARMGMIANLFWDSQPGTDPARWDRFFRFVDDNVVLANSAAAGEVMGKPIAELVLRQLNNDYQIVSAINSRFNAFGRNYVINIANKTQESIRVGIPYRKTFPLYMTFTPPPACKVSLIYEYPDFSKTIQSTLTLEAADPNALTCDRIKLVCKDHMPSFGTPGNNCDLYWRKAPALLRDDEPFSGGAIINPSKTLACVNTYLSVALKQPSQLAYYCSLVGAPIPGLQGQGCW